MAPLDPRPHAADLPPARVVRPWVRHAPRPRGQRTAELASAVARAQVAGRAAGRTFLHYAIGLWPLTVVVLLAVGLLWTAALASSP